MPRSQFGIGEAVYVKHQGPGLVVGLVSDEFQISFEDGSQKAYGISDLTALNRSNRTKSDPKLELLQRRADDPSRQISRANAVFNLVSTIVGGGVLSLPYAISKCGVIFGSFCVVLGAAMSTFSIDLLVACSRGCGRGSYSSLAHKAFGHRAKVFTGFLIFLLTWLCCVAYVVLIGDLVAPLVEFFVPNLGVWGHRVVEAISILIISPMCYMRSLHAFRFMSIFSVLSIFIVGIAIAYHSFLTFLEPHDIFSFQNHQSVQVHVEPNIKYFPESVQDVLGVFPVFGVSYLCHFNVLPVHVELRSPTRSRIRWVVISTMSICVLLYSFVSILGYFWAFEKTCGNILLNFSKTDIYISIGRGCLSLTLMSTFPLLCAPCRNSLHNLIAICITSGKCCCVKPKVEINPTFSGSLSAAPPPKAQKDQYGSLTGSPIIHVYTTTPEQNLVRWDSYESKDMFEEEPGGTQSGFWLFLETTLVILTSLLAGNFVSSILIIWTIMGATVSFTIAFILPSLFYLKMRSRRGGRFYVWGARILLIFIVCASAACTVVIVFNLDTPPCPK